MPALVDVIEEIRAEFSTKNHVRDTTLNRSRELIRFCALSIRAIHRHDWDEAAAMLQTAREAAQVMVADLGDYPDLYYTGYTQDALKELVEAHTLYSFVRGEDLPGPEELYVPSAAYLNGLAEAASELRRFVLDLIRRGQTGEGEPYLSVMDDVYTPVDYHRLSRQPDRRASPHHRRTACGIRAHSGRSDCVHAAGRTSGRAARCLNSA